MQKVNLLKKFELFSEQWTPKIVGELNGQQVKLAKVQGEFIWHCHEHEDELFFVVKGQLRICFRNGDVVLDEGELCIVPRGVEHKPVAREEVYLMMFEPCTTVNTGNQTDERTVDAPEWL